MATIFPEVMSIDEVYQYLRIPRSKLARKDQIPCQKVGRHWRFRKAAIDRWLDDEIMVVGLGEREHFGWWQSSFFTQGSSAFLSPIFSRTQFLAQCNGMRRATGRQARALPYVPAVRAGGL